MSDKLKDTIILEPGTYEELLLISLRLQVLEGPDQGKTHTIRQRSTIIGSGTEAHFVLNDQTVSRNHLEIFLEKDGYLIKDLGSKNGTRLGSLKLLQAKSNERSKLKLGNTTIELEPIGRQTKIELSLEETFGKVLGKSERMRELFAKLRHISPQDSTILLEGETGTGKELLARAIHEHSNRKENPYVILDCSVLPPSLAHRELFGHTRGSFTGAHENSRGILAKAENGTLFMDEIGELPLEMQPIFLRVLEQREFTPLGSTVSEKMSARIIAATNRNLLQDVNNQRFRADLFYRLSILHFEIPPLRERSEDIPLLANHFLKEFNASSVQAVSEMDLQNLLEPHLESLKSHPWPGNVRELRNTMERLYLKSLNVDPHQLSISLENPPKDDGLEMMCRRLVTSGASFRDAKQQTIDYFEYLYLKNLLRESNDNVSEAARRCDVDRRNFQKLIRKYGL